MNIYIFVFYLMFFASIVRERLICGFQATTVETRLINQCRDAINRVSIDLRVSTNYRRRD